jgi:hypothetical protein
MLAVIAVRNDFHMATLHIDEVDPVPSPGLISLAVIPSDLHH